MRRIGIISAWIFCLILQSAYAQEKEISVLSQEVNANYQSALKAYQTNDFSRALIDISKAWERLETNPYLVEWRKAYNIRPDLSEVRSYRANIQGRLLRVREEGLSKLQRKIEEKSLSADQSLEVVKKEIARLEEEKRQLLVKKQQEDQRSENLVSREQTVNRQALELDKKIAEQRKLQQALEDKEKSAEAKHAQQVAELKKINQEKVRQLEEKRKIAADARLAEEKLRRENTERADKLRQEKAAAAERAKAEKHGADLQKKREAEEKAAARAGDLEKKRQQKLQDKNVAQERKARVALRKIEFAEKLKLEREKGERDRKAREEQAAETKRKTAADAKAKKEAEAKRISEEKAKATEEKRIASQAKPKKAAPAAAKAKAKPVKDEGLKKKQEQAAAQAQMKKARDFEMALAKERQNALEKAMQTQEVREKQDAVRESARIKKESGEQAAKERAVQKQALAEEKEKQRIYDYQIPVAKIIAKPVKGRSPLTVRFKGERSVSKSDTIIYYIWDFGDGLTSNYINPEHTFLSYGPKEFSVTLTVKDSRGNMGTDTEVIRIVR